MDSPSFFFVRQARFSSDASVGAALPQRVLLSSGHTSSKTSSILKGSPDCFSFGGRQAGASSNSSSIHGTKHSQGTPSLFFMGGSKHHGNRRSSASPSKIPSSSPSSTKQEARQDIQDRVENDTVNHEDQDGNTLLDLKLQTCTTGSEVDEIIASISDKQLRGVQRLLCNPSILLASQKSLQALSQCTLLGFLILSLPKDCESSNPAWDVMLLTQLMASLPNLVCLDLSDCSISDENLRSISEATCASQLRALDLSFSPQVSMAGVITLLASCPLLEELDLSACEGLGVTDETFKQIGMRCPLLTSLFIEASGGQGMVGRIKSKSLSFFLLTCKQQCVLSLTGLDLDFDHTDWEALVANGSSLQSLGLSFEGSTFGDSDIQALALFLSKLCQLSSLSFRNCVSLTNEGVISALPNLPSLSELFLFNCPRIDAQRLTDNVKEIRGECFTLEASSEKQQIGPVEGLKAEPGQDQEIATTAPWSSLLSFLSLSSTGDMSVNSCRKMKR